MKGASTGSALGMTTCGMPSLPLAWLSKCEIADSTSDSVIVKKLKYSEKLQVSSKK